MQKFDMQKNANPTKGEKPAAIGLHVEYARLVNKAKGEGGKSILPKALAAGVAASSLAFLALFAIRKKREEPPPNMLAIPVGTEKQVEIAKVQGDLPPHVRENLMNNPKIDPRTLKERVE